MKPSLRSKHGLRPMVELALNYGHGCSTSQCWSCEEVSRFLKGRIGLERFLIRRYPSKSPCRSAKRNPHCHTMHNTTNGGLVLQKNNVGHNVHPAGNLYADSMPVIGTFCCVAATQLFNPNKASLRSLRQKTCILAQKAVFSSNGHSEKTYSWMFGTLFAPSTGFEGGFHNF
jgi:hypothetical protein